MIEQRKWHGMVHSSMVQRSVLLDLYDVLFTIHLLGWLIAFGEVGYVHVGRGRELIDVAACLGCNECQIFSIPACPLF